MSRKTLSGLILILLFSMSLIIFNLLTIDVSSNPVVSVDPIKVVAEPGDYFTVNISIAYAADIYQWAFELWWDMPRLLSIDRPNIAEGSFLSAGGNTIFFKNALTLSDYYIMASCSLQGDPGSNSGNPKPQGGNGVLASATFKVIGPGRHALELRKVRLWSWNWTSGSPYEIASDIVNGSFYTTMPYLKLTYSPDPSEPGNYGRPIVGERLTFNASESYDPDGGTITNYEWDFDDGNITTSPDPIITHKYDAEGTYDVNLTVTDDDGQSHSWRSFLKINFHDLAVINVTVTPTQVFSGEPVEVNVTVYNEGNFEEYLNITVYANDTPVETTLFTWYRWVPVPGDGGYWILRDTLDAGHEGTGTIIWDTTGFPADNYIIKVKAILVNPCYRKWLVCTPSQEQDLTDNTFKDGPVTLASLE